MNTSPSYFSYWGKANNTCNHSTDYHLLAFHCLDVAAVGQRLLSPDKPLAQQLSAFLEITPCELQSLFTFFLALHDLGKFASAFQKLYPSEDTALIKPGDQVHTYEGKNYRHDRLGVYFWKHSLIINKVLSLIDTSDALEKKEVNAIQKNHMILINCVFGHHGKPVDTINTQGFECFFEEKNVDAVNAFISDLYNTLNPKLPLAKLKDKQWSKNLEQISWHLAGIAVLADWVGSDQTFFVYHAQDQPLETYWKHAQTQAVIALNQTGYAHRTGTAPFISVSHHFKFNATPLQHWAETVEITNSPQLFILEDNTGSGKTEAALVLTHRLMEKGVATGFYFGLPTMATSNAMFDRIKNHYTCMWKPGETPDIVLAHSASKMHASFQNLLTDQNYTNDDQTATAQCREWLADSRKKALLSPVGVGTIDQALLAVLPRRHQSLRLLGLHNKVLIVDEVHAADEYMFKLLKELLTLHLHQGGSAVLLSATLALKQRQSLGNCWLKDCVKSTSLNETAFPLATQISYGSPALIKEQPLISESKIIKETKIKLVHSEQDCIKTLINASNSGQCCVWIRNTVNDAIESFNAICEHFDNTDHCLLFHSRFILADRQKTENKVLDIFGKNSNTKQRRGKILVATQVFQESLDVDADLIISDICPVDDLIQRLGRLYRHLRDATGKYTPYKPDKRPPPILYLHTPEWEQNPEQDWLSKQFQTTEYVYKSPGRLWLGLGVIMKLGSIRMPENARQLTEAVYGDSALEKIPASLRQKEQSLIGEQRAKAANASSQCIDFNHGYSTLSANGWTEDRYDISTRYSDIETTRVLLLKKNEDETLIPWVGNKKFAIELSTVSIAKNKYADKLKSVTEEQNKAFLQRYPQAKYLQLWLPQEDQAFDYSATMGFCEKPDKHELK